MYEINDESPAVITKKDSYLFSLIRYKAEKSVNKFVLKPLATNSHNYRHWGFIDPEVNILSVDGKVIETFNFEAKHRIIKEHFFFNFFYNFKFTSKKMKPGNKYFIVVKAKRTNLSPKSFQHRSKMCLLGSLSFSCTHEFYIYPRGKFILGEDS